MSTLELKHVSKTYDNGHCAVRDVDLRVEDGEFLVLVGPSGCGKTTLLRLIAGLEAVTAGEVLVDGEFVNNVKVRQRRIGMAFQSCALYPNMTVAENIGFPLKMDHEPGFRSSFRGVGMCLGVDLVFWARGCRGV